VHAWSRVLRVVAPLALASLLSSPLSPGKLRFDGRLCPCPSPNPSKPCEQILKLASINLCPNVSGQICCTLMMTPPEEGDPSHELVR
jgi:hypothetical protein